MEPPELIYLAGPISGIPDNNIRLFDLARDVLERKWPSAGVFVPTDLFGGRMSIDRGVYFRVDLPVLLASDMVAFLPGFVISRGATMEHRIATETNKLIYYIKPEALNV